MIVIVGHGPSVRNNELGSVIDSFDVVVRLKSALTDPVHRGMKTSVICSRSAQHRQPRIPFWLYPDCVNDWGAYWKSYARRFSDHKKPSTGTSAIFCAVELLGAKKISLIGFDHLLNPQLRHPDYTYGHDSNAEHAAVMGLGIEIVDLTKSTYG